MTNAKNNDSKSGCRLDFILMVVFALLFVALLKCSGESAIDLIRP